MSKYRFKTKQEFEADGLWDSWQNVPKRWNEEHKMDHFMEQDIPDQYNKQIELGQDFNYSDWTFTANQCILNSVELTEEETKEILNQVKNNNSLITKTKMTK